MRNICLSICIPVYNFGAFIGETLASIIPQATEEVEIVIVDGASTDNTAEVITSVQRTFPRLRYHRLEKKGGIDRDMAKSVELAQGEYCWLFGGDDIMIPGAIADILRQVQEGHDIYLCESILCRSDMTPIGKHNLLAADDGQVFDLGDHAVRVDYFSRARNTAAFFSFCSSLIFKKARWAAVLTDDKFVGSHWDHVARFFRIIPHGLRVKYLSVPHLSKRGDNDSFINQGIVNRYRITIEGFDRLSRAFFDSGSNEDFHIRRTMKAEHNLKAFLDAKLLCNERGLTEDLAVLDQLARTQYGYPLLSNHFMLFVYRFSPVALLRIAKPVYAFIKTKILSTL
ncbi:MAG: glycosyltransferase family 2 protein [Nitrospirae bacterium]|nr:glycosyltransferase family 2 protein [Nitrospirota bacterium]